MRKQDKIFKEWYRNAIEGLGFQMTKETGYFIWMNCGLLILQKDAQEEIDLIHKAIKYGKDSK